jgi:DNA repair protein RecO (recombination protein O)
LASPLHKTKGIVLRSVKYGETSLVVTILTEAFGIQSYLLNGVRVASKKGGKSQYFQPAAILDLVVYHNELKHLNRIKEYRWSTLYQHIFSDVIKNNVALFMVELLTKSLKQPEANADLYAFTEDIFMALDSSQNAVIANLPVYFALHLPYFFGFRIDDNYSHVRSILDLQEGSFVNEKPHHNYFMEGTEAQTVSEILRVMEPGELLNIKLQRSTRQKILQLIEAYYSFHIHEFGTLKTLPVLRELMN